MSILPVTNPHPGNPDEPAPGTKPERPPRPKKKGKNYAQIHSKPLPLEIHPLPAFHPSNPISLLRLAYTFISHLLSPPVSHPAEPYIGYFSPETRSVHVTHPDHVRALWEMGFFGKGILSRSEPSWLEREEAKLRRERFGAEEATNARREERRLFKLERARAEAEKIYRQRLVEGGKVGADGGDEVRVDASVDGSSNDISGVNGQLEDGTTIDGRPGSENTLAPPQTDSINDKDSRVDFSAPNYTPQQTPTTNDPPLSDSDPIQNQEHLQLTLEESLFLSYGLGVLTILPAPTTPTQDPLTTRALLELSLQHTPLPPTPWSWEDLSPDHPFLLSYAVYHHYRSLGWVVRPAQKFGADYLLYARGPALSHAEFAVRVVPAYTHRFWNTPGGRLRRRVQVDEGEGMGWWGLHATNRVQSQVKKTLVLCYVDVPSPLEVDFDFVEGGEVDLGVLLRSFRVREFVVRRWVPSRTRD